MVSGFANYSWQDDPELLDDRPAPYPPGDQRCPPTHRFNAGVNCNDRRFLGSLSVNYADEAFWTDVLGAAFNGFTDAYTMVNASVGVKWVDGKLTTALKGTNILNDDNSGRIQQHIFGDILKRSIVGEVRFQF